jgi:hypothetical protein
MPQAKQSGSTDSSGNAQGRFTVQLPAELRPMIDALGRDATAKVSADTGIDIELSMAQVVTGIIKAQHKVMSMRQAEAARATEATSDES